jgi:hypothetical protein
VNRKGSSQIGGVMGEERSTGSVCRTRSLPDHIHARLGQGENIELLITSVVVGLADDNVDRSVHPQLRKKIILHEVL